MFERPAVKPALLVNVERKISSIRRQMLWVASLINEAFVSVFDVAVMIAHICEVKHVHVMIHHGSNFIDNFR